MALDPIEIKEKFERENPERIVIQIAKYHRMYILLAPRKTRADEYIESNIYLVNKRTGAVVGNPSYSYDFRGFNKALNPEYALYLDEVNKELYESSKAELFYRVSYIDTPFKRLKRLLNRN